MAPGEQKITYPIQYWRLKADGIEDDALFLTAQLPTLTLNNAELRHVGTKASPETTTVNVNHQWSALSLTRGVDKKGTLWKWIEQGLPQKGGGGSKLEKKEVTIELCNSQDQPVQTWTFTGAWPSGYTGPSLDSNSGQYAIEMISFEFDDAEVKFSG